MSDEINHIKSYSLPSITSPRNHDTNFLGLAGGERRRRLVDVNNPKTIETQ